MADASIDLQASNLFGLASTFKTQSSTTSAPQTNVYAVDQYGDVVCERNIKDITNYSQNAMFCQGPPLTSGFVEDLTTILTKFGETENSKLVTGITVTMNAGQPATIDITGHNHTANAHGTMDYSIDMSALFPHGSGDEFELWDGFGVPAFGIDTTEASPISATVTLSVNHIDQIAQDGTHLVGKSVAPRWELSMTWSGIPTTFSGGDIDDVASAIQTYLGLGGTYEVMIDNHDLNDSNSAFDSFAFTAHMNLLMQYTGV